MRSEGGMEKDGGGSPGTKPTLSDCKGVGRDGGILCIINQKQ